MRPRISRKEASYLVEVLKTQEPVIAEKQERLKELELKLFTLKQRWRTEGSVHVFRELKTAKTEFERLNSELHTLFRALELHQKLIEKYQAIANGVSHQGTYKHFNCGLEWRLAITETRNLSEVAKP